MDKSCGARSQATLISFWNNPRVQPARADIANFAEVALLDDLLNLPDGRRVKKRVAGHQHQAVFPGGFHQFLTMLHRTGHRFLDERMFARQQRRLGHREMVGHAGGDDHGVEIDAVEHVRVVRFPFNFGVKFLEVTQPRRVEIAHHPDMAIGQRPEIADQIRAPVTAASHPESSFFSHIKVGRESG